MRALHHPRRPRKQRRGPALDQSQQHRWTAEGGYERCAKCCRIVSFANDGPQRHGPCPGLPRTLTVGGQVHPSHRVHVLETDDPHHPLLCICLRYGAEATQRAVNLYKQCEGPALNGRRRTGILNVAKGQHPRCTGVRILGANILADAIAPHKETPRVQERGAAQAAIAVSLQNAQLELAAARRASASVVSRLPPGALRDAAAKNALAPPPPVSAGERLAALRARRGL